MRSRFFVFSGIFFLLAIPAFAHLCNDVFIQAKDNLAVKVDIRDDQLRINKTGKFRVYLLNTMDRDIVDIRLDVKSGAFKSEVTPSPAWRRYPYLKTSKRGGKKEYFEVELTRKSGTASGKYKIELHLYNGRDPSMVFKDVDINAAISARKVPLAPKNLAVDGSAKRSEWGKALICKKMYEYEKCGRYFENNYDTNVNTSFYFYHDQNNILCLVNFRKDTGSDKACIYISPDSDSTPLEIKADLQNKSVTVNGRSDSKIKVTRFRNMLEISMPMSILGIKGKKSFLANMTRNSGRTRTYWKGNRLSYKNPIVYANFILN